MQHYKYKTIRSLYLSPEVGFIKSFLRANIKTLFTFPKSVWYSLRLNSGENFLLQNRNLYPYVYNNIDRASELDMEPVGLSNRLMANINELQVIKYCDLTQEKECEEMQDIVKDLDLLQKQSKQLLWGKFAGEKTSFDELKGEYTPSTYLGRNREKIVTSIMDSANETLKELTKFATYGDCNQFPAAVSARILYSFAKNFDLRFINETINKIDPSLYYKLISSFTKKLEFADAESISYVLYALARLHKFEDTQLWTSLLTELECKYFTPEFTSVSTKEPFLFRYRENGSGDFDTEVLDEFGNKLMMKGYNSIFEAYLAMHSAEKNDVDTRVFRTKFSERFPEVKAQLNTFLNRR